MPKANDQLVFPDGDLVRRWRALRTQALDADSNLHAVRVVACSPDQSAYESWDAGLGGRHGALTAALVPLLTGPDAGTVTWLDMLEVVRRAVLGVSPLQRPEVEGPADRLLFSLRSRTGTGVLPVRVEAGSALLVNAAIFGIAVGDRYALVAPGRDAAVPLATAVVERIRHGRAVLRLDGTTPAELPVGTAAWPVEVALGQRPVAVLPVDSPHRDEIVADLERSARVRPVDNPAGALATVRLDGDGVQVLDAAGEPLYGTPRPVSPKSLASAAADVGTLAMADHVRALPSGTGPAELPGDVAVSYVRLLPGGGESPLAPGEHLFVGDRLLVRITSSSAQDRYASVFDVGVAGAVTLLTTSEPSGVTLAPGEGYELGREWGVEGGIRLDWADGVPRGAARPESFVTVIADAKVNRLPNLGQLGVARRAAGPASTLDRLIDDVAVGRRDVRPPGGGHGVRHRVDRFDFLLHPVPRPADGEPAFDVDERPDPSFRLVVPRGPVAPGRVAVRLKELTVHSNRSFLASRVRVDAMVITAAPAEAGGPYRANTMRFDRIRDGDRLPFDDVLLYEGPVARFLDIAVWVAKDDSRDLDLAELLAAESANEEVSAAATTLAALAVAEPTAALVAGSAAAVAMLVRTAAR